MDAGEVVAGRFEIERLGGTGGMGHVYFARDRASGEHVALKVIAGDAAAAMGHHARFAREAASLEALSAEAPGIVRHVAHGATRDGALWLAMEWLEGETLAERLARQGLAVADSVALAARVAATLGAIHRKGFVHRDLKPSNIFLPGGEIDAAKLIDFGIARGPTPDLELTEPGAMLGTPGYVAPEQARGAAGVDARADVFSLGCVLFRCLAGRGPFVGDDRLGILLKVVLEDPPLLRQVRGGIPEALEALVARMLAKAPAQRPSDGDAVVAAIRALPPIAGRTSSTGSVPPPSILPGTEPSLASAPELTGAEKRVMCLVLTRDARAVSEATLSRSQGAERERALRATVERHRGKLELLADRSLFVVLSSAGAATDLAARAARCALSIRALLGEVPIAAVTGRGVISSRLPVGELIDRAVALLGASPPRGGVRLDDVTQGLLDARFEVGSDEAGAYLGGERDPFEAARTLLGKPTPCVGREPELAMLEAMFARAAEDRAPAVALVTAPAGMGKSRLCFEIVRRVREREDAPAIWIGRADPMGAGSAFGLLAQALRRAMSIGDGAPLDAQRSAILWSVDGMDDAARVADFLGELVGAPFPDDRVQLRAARRDAVLMGDQMRRAFEDLCAFTCESRPLLLVLEDLHWGDLPTVRFVDAALRSLRDRPFMVLALGRPEVRDVFPKLWAGRGLRAVELGELSRRACERLVRTSLGDGVPAETMDTIVERAEGNAFYLEELIRAVAEGHGAALPETVLAMVQGRVEGLAAEDRRVLRAASVFGRTFWEGGVAALLGGASVTERLGSLAERELVARRPVGRFPGEIEYEFRHALLREAAYAMLTERDRTLGHELAGAWLERAGEVDAMALAEHKERGGDPARAARWYLRATEQAMEGNDVDGALARVARGLACSSGNDAERGELRVLEARALGWKGENAAWARSGLEAMRLLPVGGAGWCEAAGAVLLASGKLGDIDQVVETSMALLAVGREDVARLGSAASYGVALTRPVFYLLFADRYKLAEALLEEAESIAAWCADPLVLAQVHHARATQALPAGDLGAYLRHVEASRSYLEHAGDRRGICTRAANVGYAHLQLGEDVEAERALVEALAEAERIGLLNMRPYVKHNLGLALARQGRFDEARAAEEEAVAAFHASGDRRLEIASRTYLATILALAGDPRGAAEVAASAAAEPGAPPALRACALATLADARIAEGRAAEALAAAREAMEILGALRGIEEGEPLIRLVYAEALFASGDVETARTAIMDASGRLFERSMKVTDPALRASFLARVPENARTLKRARAWLGGPDAGR